MQVLRGEQQLDTQPAPFSESEMSEQLFWHWPSEDDYR